ncbi:MAG: F0F1 ATP synthase subunit A [Pseudomonadota bacterium]
MHTFELLPWIAEKLSLPFKIDHSNVHIATSLLIAFFLIISSLLVYRKLRHTDQLVIPSNKLSISTIYEITVGALLHMMENIMGQRAIKYFPLIGSLFVYILICNLIGIIPGMVPPTSNINTNLGCAICVFVYYNYVGIRELGFIKYLQHLAGPVIWLAPLMLTIEIISHIVRPISLSVRLFGNMVGDHLVVEIFSGLIPLFVPIFFLLLAIFVAFIQAFVFSLLSCVYIALATEPGEH